MRYRVERPGAGNSPPLEIVDCKYIELCDAGVLAFLDADKILLRAFAAGTWVTLTRIADEAVESAGELDLYRDATHAAVGIKG